MSDIQAVETCEETDKRMISEIHKTDTYIAEFIELFEKIEDRQSVNKLLQISDVFHKLRITQYGKVLYRDGSWKYLDELNEDEVMDVKKYLNIL